MLRYILFACIFLVGCQKRDCETPSGKLHVLSTLAMINDLVQEIGGEHVDAKVLIRGELNPHSYELVKGDDEKFSQADLIFYNGLGLEHGLSLRQHLEGNEKAVAVSEPLLRQDPSPILISEGGQYDPHVWMDISLWMQTIDPMVAALSEKLPEAKEEFQKRGEALKEKMRAADLHALQILQAIPSQKRYLVTSHDAFHYFTRHYLKAPEETEWQQRCRAPEGLSPEAQLSVTDLLDIMHHIDQYHIRVVFPESNLSKDSLKKLAEACSSKGFTLSICDEKLFADSMGSASCYLEMIEHNVRVIAKGLNL